MMIGTLELMDAVSALAAENLPELDQVYLELTPELPHRPYLVIQAVSDSEQDAACALVARTVILRMTLFGAETSNADNGSRKLTELQDRLSGLFRRGFLKVRDRSLEVHVTTGAREQDKVTSDLRLYYHDLRDETSDGTPLMSSVETTMDVKN